MTSLAAGDTAPSFTLSDADLCQVSLSDFAGGAVIVYFYPAAMTPGCTLEAIDFTTHLDAFAAAGYQVVGISPDTPEKLAKFRTTKDLRVRLLSDQDKTVINQYGVWGSKMLYGKEVEGLIRSSFVVDVDAEGVGTIRNAYTNVRSTGHVERLMRDLAIESEGSTT